MEASCIRRDNDKKHVYHLLVKSAILEVPLDIASLLDHTNEVGLDRSRPAIPRHRAQALHLARSPAESCWDVHFLTFIIDRRRELRCPGIRQRRSAARQSSVVSLPLE